MTDGKNVKALFRRGKARRLCGQTDGARTDLNAAMKLSPKDSAILKEAQVMLICAADRSGTKALPEIEQSDDKPIMGSVSTCAATDWKNTGKLRATDIHHGKGKNNSFTFW